MPMKYIGSNIFQKCSYYIDCADTSDTGIIFCFLAQRICSGDCAKGRFPRGLRPLEGGGRGEIGEGGAWAPQLPLLTTTGGGLRPPSEACINSSVWTRQNRILCFCPTVPLLFPKLFYLYHIGCFLYFCFTFKNNIDKWDKVPVSLVPQGFDASHFYFGKRDIFAVSSKQADMPAFQCPGVPLLNQQMGQIPPFPPF